MKDSKLIGRKTASTVATGSFEFEVEDYSDTDIRQFQVTSDFYDRRSRIWSKIRKGDLWIALGVYLFLSGVAFVVL